MYMRTRKCVFGLLLSVYYFFIAGIFGRIISLLIALCSSLVFYNCSFELLPHSKLIKFAHLFVLDLPATSSPMGHRDSLPGTPSSISIRFSATDLNRRIILHRGGCLDTPENTLEAIREAASKGVAGVEIDLQFTSDGVGILLHDDTLDRTTDGTGEVTKSTFEEIQQLNAAAKHKNRDKYKYKVSVPTLEECLRECIKLNLLVFIDCKAFPQKMRRKDPSVITALTYRKGVLTWDVDGSTPRHAGIKHYISMCADFLFTLATYTFTWKLCGNSVLLLNKDSICRNEVRWWKSLGIHLLPWTVNSESEKMFFLQDLNLPVITDDVNPDTFQGR